jgi:hypothetical protein
MANASGDLAIDAVLRGIVPATSLMPVRSLMLSIGPQYAGFCGRLMYQCLDSVQRLTGGLQSVYDH